MGRGIPDRWEAYSAFGTIIKGTRFFPFKVPLKEALCKDLPGDQKFTPRILIDRVQDLQLSQPQEQPMKLGLVIDLTNTSRYYDPKEITKHNIRYEKIFTEGHNVPAASVRRRFKDVVSHFLKENSNNGLLIGVHCTHGVNRTGYLVCRYMIDCMQANPADAVTSFNECRGHTIERENYLQHLANVSSASDLAAEMEASPTHSLPLPPPGAAECVQPPQSQRWLRRQERRTKKKLQRQQATELWRQPQPGRRPDDERHWLEHENAVHSQGGHAAWQPPLWPGPFRDSRPLAHFPDGRAVELPPHSYRGRAGAAAAGSQWQDCQAARWSGSTEREWDGAQLPGYPWPAGCGPRLLLPAAEHVADHTADCWRQPWQQARHVAERWHASDQGSRAWTAGYYPAVPLSKGEDAGTWPQPR